MSLADVTSEANAIAEAALACVGIPYRFKGRSPTGVDCVGLVLMALERGAGLVLEYWDYSDNPMTWRPITAMTNRWRRIGADSMQPGDIVALRAKSRVTHLGIYTDQGVVHADNEQRMVVCDNMEDHNAPQLTAVWSV